MTSLRASYLYFVAVENIAEIVLESVKRDRQERTTKPTFMLYGGPKTGAHQVKSLVQNC